MTKVGLPGSIVLYNEKPSATPYCRRLRTVVRVYSPDCVYSLEVRRVVEHDFLFTIIIDEDEFVLAG